MKRKLHATQKMPVVSIYLENIPIPLNAVIDTGCRDNIIFTKGWTIDETFFKRTGNNIYAQSVGRNVNGIEIQHKLTLGKYNFDLKFALMNEDFGEFKIILGTLFLHENKMSLHINGDNFILKKASNLEYLVCRTGILSY